MFPPCRGGTTLSLMQIDRYMCNATSYILCAFAYMFLCDSLFSLRCEYFRCKLLLFSHLTNLRVASRFYINWQVYIEIFLSSFEIFQKRKIKNNWGFTCRTIKKFYKHYYDYSWCNTKYRIIDFHSNYYSYCINFFFIFYWTAASHLI